MLLKHYLDQGVSKSELARRFGISRATIHHWVKTGQLDRDLLAGPRAYSSRPPVAHKLDPYKGIIDARLKAFPKLSAKRLFDEVRAAGYPGCLPIFREQSRVCADHFRSETCKCQGSGSVRIGDFTGFSCTVTATVVEEGEETEGAPGIAPADRWTQARTRTNVRSGPGTQYDKVGLLETGEKVHVTGEWLRIEGPDGSTAFVHGSLLVPPALQGRDAAAGLSPKCSGMSKGAECWLELADRPGCYIFDPCYSPPETATWSGACRDGVAVGQGARGWDFASGSGEATGTLARGKQHGRWVIRSANGNVYEGPFVDGKLHGHWVFRFANGTVREGPYVDGERHGRWITRHAGGGRLELDYRNDSSEGQPGIYITGSGERHQGRWSGKCFRDGDGYAWAASGGWDNCPNN